MIGAGRWPFKATAQEGLPKKGPEQTIERNRRQILLQGLFETFLLQRLFGTFLLQALLDTLLLQGLCYRICPKGLHTKGVQNKLLLQLADKGQKDTKNIETNRKQIVRKLSC